MVLQTFADFGKVMMKYRSVCNVNPAQGQAVRMFDSLGASPNRTYCLMPGSDDRMQSRNTGP